MRCFCVEVRCGVVNGILGRDVIWLFDMGIFFLI